MQSPDVACLDPGKGTSSEKVEEEGEGETIQEEEGEEEEEEEVPFPLTCPNSGCKFSIADESEEKKMTNHSKVCEFQVSLLAAAVPITSFYLKQWDGCCNSASTDLLDCIAS